ncbi:hypothetical protein [Streptomyces prunicolor]
MTVSFCKHGFPLQPPLGSLAHPGDCACGVTYADAHAELDRQAMLLRLGTAHEGACDGCGQTRLLFRYQPEQQPWGADEAAVRWLCTPDWSKAREREEDTGFIDFNDLFDRGTDEQLEAGLRGAA